MKTMKTILTTVAFIAISLALIGSAQAQTCGTTTWNLTAGQYTDVGSVTVSNDANNVYVRYTLDYPGAYFGTLHVWVGNNLLNLPAVNNGPNAGTPIPGQFCQSLGGDCYDATGLTDYTFTIPFSALNIVDASAGCGSALYVFAHAEVKMDSDGDGIIDASPTAFGGNIDVNVDEPGRWYFYGVYTVCCDFGPPPECFSKTAFAKGGWVFVTDKKANPENLPSLNLIRNRWGWAINLKSPVTNATYDIWAGAGLNYTSKGVKVGTLKVTWDGSTAVVNYELLSGYLLEEVHVYAGDARPTTTAPGQYGYPTVGYDVGGVQTYSLAVPLADSNGADGVWLIAHAVVSNGYCN